MVILGANLLIISTMTIMLKMTYIAPLLTHVMGLAELAEASTLPLAILSYLKAELQF
jgi:hypothetical protein